MALKPGYEYYANFVTEKGPVKIRLFAEEAPETVNNFVFLARDGYFDGTTFHRVIPDFMAQGGDPTGTGPGGPGYDSLTIPSRTAPRQAGHALDGERRTEHQRLAVLHHLRGHALAWTAGTPSSARYSRGWTSWARSGSGTRSATATPGDAIERVEIEELPRS